MAHKEMIKFRKKYVEKRRFYSKKESIYLTDDNILILNNIISGKYISSILSVK